MTAHWRKLSEMIDEKHIGSSLRDLLQEERRLDEASRVAAKRVLSWQLQQAMRSPGQGWRLCRAVRGPTNRRRKLRFLSEDLCRCANVELAEMQFATAQIAHIVRDDGRGTAGQRQLNQVVVTQFG